MPMVTGHAEIQGSPMSARAPQAIFDLWNAIQRAIPQAKLGGIVGDTAHSFGYHLARRDLPASDYSVELPADRLGAADCAAALDVTLPPDLMITCTTRLVRAARARDPRLKAVREFCGTLNGRDTYPWQLQPRNASEGLNTWDDSHLWHIHLSFLREYADNAAVLAPIADVFAGVPLKAAPTDPNWSDMATKAEIENLIADALRAVLVGGDHGDFTQKAHPWLVKDANHGVLDRLAALEAKK